MRIIDPDARPVLVEPCDNASVCLYCRRTFFKAHSEQFTCSLPCAIANLEETFEEVYRALEKDFRELEVKCGIRIEG